MGVLDIRAQFAQYGEYHSNKINIAIHMVFVPIILWCSLSLATSLFPAELAPWPKPVAELLQLIPGPAPLLNISAATAAGFGTFYIMLDVVAGLLAAPLLYVCLVTSQQFALRSADAWQYSLGLFVVAWIAQFLGHGVFERRAPALVDSLAQALVMAPFFVFLEALFAFGYRPALHREVRNEIGMRILAFRHKDKKHK
ncbi:hypothetical protein LPJ61_005708 [Coemansia biformis]|uniref:DUF962-domain-containing protein n=1 Tax=Coemansia biformis TaxID=1286918 RepID=A0A9W8CT82_9FUNG|nr:hypothetical protein LPJ61_005708 [Coemansia biformis]